MRLWVGLWFLLVVIMATALVASHRTDPLTYGLVFVGWCGGLVSLLAAQALARERKS